MWARPAMVLCPGTNSPNPQTFPNDGIDITINNYLGTPHPGYVPMLQFGGAGLQQSWGTITPNLLATQSITGAGFKPDLVMVFGISTPGFSDGSIAPTWGCATGPGATEQWAYGARQDYGGVNHTSDPQSGIYDGALIWSNRPSVADAFRPTSDFLGTLTSMDSDGFSLAWTYGTINTIPVYYWVAMRHPTARFKAGVETQKTTNGVKSTTVGWKPQTTLFMASSSVTLKTLTNDHTIATGMATRGVGFTPVAANQSVYTIMPWISGGGNGGENWRYHSDALCLKLAYYNTTLGDATCLMTNTGFDLTWANVNGAAKTIGYLAFEGGDNWSGDEPTAYMFFGGSLSPVLNAFEADSPTFRTSFYYGSQIGLGTANCAIASHWERAADALLAQGYETSTGARSIGGSVDTTTGLWWWSGSVPSADPLPSTDSKISFDKVVFAQ